MTSQSFVLLDDNSSQDRSRYLFSDPVEVVCCDRKQDLLHCLTKIEDGLKRGLYAAGYFSYELGHLFEPKLERIFTPSDTMPLFWIGLFKSRQRLSDEELYERLDQRGGDAEDIRDLSLSMDKGQYVEAFQKAQDYIAAGDVYQINLTLKYLFRYGGDPIALYRELRRKQKVAFGGIVATPDFHVLSLSPELFFNLRDGEICSRPMKGTAPRGMTPESDKAIADWLREDEKSRAENLMIVDLLRNDLGRISEIGSVRVTDLYTIESYRTVHQMTSGICGKIKKDLSVSEILKAIFPCGSVTGAPKVRAMEVIHELETAPRGVYTGSMGMLCPNGDGVFNVMIRTLFLDSKGNGEMGIGSGIVADSDVEAEFEECLLKAHFLTKSLPVFELIETMRWESSSGYFLLERHMERLERSAAHFGFCFDGETIRAQLLALETELKGPVEMVRLLLNERGDIKITHSEITLPEKDAVWRLALSDRPLDQDDIFFYHKTTRRDFYTQEYERYQNALGSDEVIFVNKQGELTEGSRTNLFLEKDGQLLTPAASSGLLPGTLREEMLAQEDLPVREARLRIKDLQEADQIFLGNSVRGLVKAEWVNNEVRETLEAAELDVD